jgi:hypothetical protein
MVTPPLAVQNAQQIFNINGANVTLSRLTLANGYAKGGDGFNGGGGGFRTQGDVH